MSQVLDYPKPTPLKYPITDKNIWGPHEWFLWHNTASMYPDKPNRSDRIEYRKFYDFLIRHLPCIKPCRDNTYKYMKSHPIDLKSKKRLFAWTVKLHDYVNEETGKAERFGDNPDALLEAHTCETCSYSHEPQAEVVEKEPVSLDDKPTVEPTVEPVNNNPDIITPPVKDVSETNAQATPEALKPGRRAARTRLEQWKDITKKIVEDECRRRNVPTPNIIFNDCPDNSNTSCITSEPNSAKRTIYYNPKNFSVKSLYHELKHHIDLHEGKPANDTDGINNEADDFALRQIEEQFPYDGSKVVTPTTATEQSPDSKSITTPATTATEKSPTYIHDKLLDRAIKDLSYDTMSSDDRAKQLVHDVYNQPSAATMPRDPSQISGDFPMFKQALQEIEKEEIKDKIRNDSSRQGSGVLSHIDSIYEYPAQMMGLAAADLNHIHTPRIITTAAQTLIESYTKPITAASLSAVFGIFLMVMCIFIHKKLPIRDVLLMQTIGSQFFFDTLRYLNPKKLAMLGRDLTELQRDVQKHRFGIRSLLETPGEYKYAMEANKIKELNDIQVASPEGLETLGEVSARRLGETQLKSTYTPYGINTKPGGYGSISGRSPRSGSNYLSTEGRLRRSPYGVSPDNSNVLKLPPYRTEFNFV